MEQNQWHWQEPDTSWKGIGIYHVTLTIPSREPLLGSMLIPHNNPAKACVRPSELGRMILDCHRTISVYHPEIQVLQYCLMPDHLHSIWYVRHPMQQGVREVVRGFWQACRNIGREFSSVAPNGIRKEDPMSSIFTEMPFIRPMSRHGQLQTMIRYVQMNPQRFATKLLKPGYFCVQDGIEIAGRVYRGVGNAKLLQNERFVPVHVRHTLEETARQGNDHALREYMNSCVVAAREGAVMVSPFISANERAVMTILLEEKRPLIYIESNGFRDYYKPSGGLFDAVAEGNVLILSPWEYNPLKKHVSRDECVEMNHMAEEIAGYGAVA